MIEVGAQANENYNNQSNKQTATNLKQQQQP